MHITTPILSFEYCTLSGKEKKCFSLTLSKTLAQIVVGFMAVIVVLSFFFGWGAGGIDMGIDYLAMSGVYALLSIVLLIPVVGLVILIGFLPAALADTLTLLGIVANGYTAALGAAVFWFGLVGQIIVLIHIIVKLIKRADAPKEL
jgi:hypothetical protein